MTGEADELDRGRVERMAEAMARIIRDNFLSGPPSSDRALEALNALAFCAASMIAGTGDRFARRNARAFLDAAVTQNVKDILRNPRPMH